MVVSPEHYERMRGAREDAEDVAAFDEAIAEEGPSIPWGSGEGRSGLGVTHHVVLRPAAVRALQQIDHQDRDRIRGAIALLGKDPRPPGAKALQGRPGQRVRIGDYRIICTVDDNILVVAGITLGHRRDAYDR